MPAHYEQHGVSFYYPENWQLSEQDRDWPREVVLESPGGAMWSLHIYFPPVDTAKIAAEALQAMRNEYPELEVEPVEELVGPWPAQGHNLYFYFLDLLVNIRTRCFQFQDKTLLIIEQAEDREFTELEPVFQAITTSLLRPDL